ncbi:S9 family peptidase [Actinosynnema pretiosum subsp. pretiosum]|uniref:S9 family peptidase n=1 Tax=Actinosynnema pretiosum subsp. pretiosum TaxID=103721 RepID=A0AA45R1A4_9PSEU|nr:prolyl oligopeptidase family protein [Actinosynnema pretiosum subsp. pretiosum]QUF01474.1 S9 family peptidase [Actinosynnema pretiosum subsp. pretiosum]
MELTAELVVSGLRVGGPAVSPDGRSVVFAARGVGDGAEERPEGLRWCGEPAELVFRVGGQLCAVGASGPARVLADLPEGVRWHLPLASGEVALAVPGLGGASRLSLLDPVSGVSRAVDLGDRHVAEAAQRPGGGPLAVLTWEGPGYDPGLLRPRLHLVEPEGLAVRDLGPVAAGAEGLAWWRSGDRWRLAHLALTPPGLQAGMAVFDAEVPESGAIVEHVNRTAGMAACPLELVQVERGAPLVLVAAGLDTEVHRLGADGLTLLARHEARVERLAADGAGEVVAAVVSRADAPPDVCSGPVGGDLTRVSDSRPELRGIRWGERRRLSCVAVDGVELDGLLVLPPGKAEADGPFPMVVLPHGGPYDRHADGFALDWHPSAQWLAHAGFAALLPNPRGGSGRGHEFAAAVAGRAGHEELGDLLALLDHVVGLGVADPERVGIAGWSHGGYLAAWAVATTDRFAAALVGAGVSDWGRQGAEGEWGAFDAALACGEAEEHDPVARAGGIRVPVLVVHGAEDVNVPVSQAELLRDALVEHGVEHELVVYEGEGHVIEGVEQQVDLLERTREWFTRWLGVR